MVVISMGIHCLESRRGPRHNRRRGGRGNEEEDVRNSTPVLSTRN